MTKVNILFEKCDKEKANDTGLPYTAYLVTYLVDGVETYDISTANKTVELFDHYYDKYKKNFIRFDQTNGRINPKLYGYQSPEASKKS
jgi:hypothetical protein|tara:strand:- start:3703 stop:3966 length:264 start_codon:yes stop_codon:yes gene_type:complete